MWQRSAWLQGQRLRQCHHIPEDVRQDSGKDQIISVRDEGQRDCVQEKLSHRRALRHPQAAVHKEDKYHTQLKHKSQNQQKKLPNGQRDNLNILQVHLKLRPPLVPPPLCAFRQCYRHVEETRSLPDHGPRPQRNDHFSEERTQENPKTASWKYTLARP